MSKLPFVVAPRLKPRLETLGTEASGQIEIERRGYLSVGEKGFMSSVQSQDVALHAVMKMSRQVAKKFGIGQQEAYEEVVIAVTEPGNSKYPVYDEFAEEIAGLAGLMVAQEQRKGLMQAFCLLLYRVNPELSIEDIQSLHEDLIAALSDLFVDEENKSIERLLEDQEEAEEVATSDEVDTLSKK